MPTPKTNLNDEVTKFLDALNHPFREEIEQLRVIILEAARGLTENIKWNGPNYCFDNDDRITMKIQPPKQIQLIFHRGAKVQKQPQHKLIKEDTGLLTWKENDRAVATFKKSEDIKNHGLALTKIVQEWIEATSANKSEPETYFFGPLAAPARRALENNGIDTLEKLSKLSEKDVLAFHGMGKSSMPTLKKALHENGLSFKIEE
uniref:DUF1801 domain-containing protein n=1 Tax=Roseihalotalea indica TaxID=2867963 RepID=A0AA49JE90_9BACT|nr:DUF1801 domain-containing protein [Tunicatimonas sp. TK19036]